MSILSQVLFAQLTGIQIPNPFCTFGRISSICAELRYTELCFGHCDQIRTDLVIFQLRGR